MTRTILFAFILFLTCQFALAQNTPVRQLEEIVISDVQLKKFTTTQSVQKLNDSIIKKNNPLLTHLLNFQTGIYFKEQGYGMTSTASFRGTTGSQTAVIWNGININSQLLGQTDFNTLNTTDFSSISVRAGGGSVIYGSGAIGGSIHLNNELLFQNIFENNLKVEYGSYATTFLNYSVKAGFDKLAVNVGFTRQDSDNDYEILGTKRINLNGGFYNSSFNANFGYKLNKKNVLKLFSNYYSGERHFSVLFSSEIPTKYQNFNAKNLLEWDGFYGKFISKLKVGFLSEEYKYFPDIKKDGFSFGKVETLVAKYDLSYDLLENMKLNSVIDFTQNKGNGSDIDYENRQISSANLLLSHKIGKVSYEATARQEVTNNYKSPFLWSAGVRWQVASFYAVRANGSKNFRIPSFDDLYWVGSGNRDLKPEVSIQGELGNEFKYKNILLEIVGYYNDITDMIRWVPAGSVWKPVNTDKVESYGVESKLTATHNFGKHYIGVTGTYNYTVSKNKDTDKQLIYVPYHKATVALSYSYRRVTAYYQNMFVGEVFTRTDNNPKYNIKDYNVTNFGADFGFGKKHNFKLGCKMNNVWNEKYEVVEGRFMPGRNYNAYINFKF